MKAAIVVVLALVVCSALSACESTQDKSARLAKQGGASASEKGVTVSKQTKDVAVVSSAAFQDPNGAVAVVTVRNKTAKPLTSLPIAIDVQGAGRKTVFRNDAPGLELSLASIQTLPANTTLTWINDQVTPTAKPKSVRARVGAGKPLSGSLPRITVSKVKLESDPVSGVAAVGKVTNRSKVEQRKLIVYAVARRGDRVVAAGRAQIKKVKPGKTANFTAFFIGNPKGANLQIAAPPTTYQ